MEECVGQSFPASMADYMCTSWVSTFSSKSTFSKHKARHLEFRRKVTEEEEWALATMIQVCGLEIFFLKHLLISSSF